MSPSERLIQQANLAATGEAPIRLVTAVYNEAVRTKNWQAAKIICSMPDGPGKPVEAHIDKILSNAETSRNDQEIYEIRKIFRNEIYQPVFGPLNKSNYTTQLELLTRELMQPNGAQLTIYKDARGHICLYLPSGNDYNWSSIRKFSNLQHIMLNKDDFHLYRQYLYPSPLKVLEISSEMDYKYRHYEISTAH